jgi:FixJ family two-component response regulator
MVQECPTRQILIADLSGIALRRVAGAECYPLRAMGHRSDVLFLDDDEDLRATFADLVRTIYDRECHGVRSYGDLLDLGDRALRCGVAILDINLGPQVPSGLDAYGWLRKHGFDGRIVFLTGHAASHPLVVEAKRLGDAEVVGKPVSLETLTSMLEDHARFDEHAPA